MKTMVSPVFNGISEDELAGMKAASCLREKNYAKGEYIFRMGDVTTKLGIVLSGSVVVENEDVWGNTGILTKVHSGGVFAETYALCRLPMMVSAKAMEDSRIQFLDLRVLDTYESSAFTWQRKLSKNLLDISARKNITLSERMFCISSKTVRGRVLVYLSKQARLSGSSSFRIPFDRQQMADYLNVDRSALSKELGKMKEEGLIDFNKNHFVIYSEESFRER